MKNRIVTLLLVSALLFISAEAQTAPTSALLYKVSGKKLKKPSYIFGTMHVICEKDLTFAEQLGAYIGKTDQMMLEVDLDDTETVKKIAEAASLKDGKTLKDYLTSEEFTKLDNIYKSYLGISIELLQNLKPIMVSTYLFMSPKIVGCAQPSTLDQDLAEVAKQRKNAVIGLETVEQQIAALDSTPLSEQLKSLKDISSNPDKHISKFQNMYKVYISQDSDALYEIIEGEMSDQISFKEELLDKRNKNWIPLIESQIVLKPTFIGFGAGHLGGKKGVVALLRSKGYKLTPIRF